MLSQKFTTYIFIGLTILSTLQPAKATDQDLYLLAGDVSNIFVADIFKKDVAKKNKKLNNLKQDPATYTTNNQAARISNIIETNSNFLSTDAKDCSNAQIFKMSDDKHFMYLACGDDVQIFEVNDDNTLATPTEENIGNKVWDYHLTDKTQKLDVVLSINPNTGPTEAFSFDFTVLKPTKVERKINQKAWQTSAIQDKAAFEIWQFNDGATPPVITPFWVGYQRQNDLTKPSANYLLWAKSDEDISGKLDLTAANKFPEDATHVTDLSFNDANTMIITYKGADVNLKVAECTMAYDGTATPPAVSITACTASTTAPEIAVGNIVIRQPVAANPGTAYIYNDAAKQISIAVYNAGAFSAFANSKAKVVYGSDLEFYNIKTSSIGNEIQFAKKGTTQIINTLFNIVKDDTDVTYDQISDREGSTSVSKGNTGFIIKAMSYSVYEHSINKVYVSLIAGQFASASQDVVITKTQGAKTDTFTYGVNISPDLKSGALIRRIPDYQDYKREAVTSNKLSINRKSFFGNNLDFQFSLEGFQVMNANDFTFDTASLGTSIWLHNYKLGLGFEAAKVSGLKCTGTVLEKNFVCTKNEEISYDIPAGSTLVHVESVTTGSENGAILIYSTGDDTNVAYIDFANEQVNVGKITGAKSAKGKVFFKIVKDQFSVWIVDPVKNVADVYASAGKTLASFESKMTISTTTIKKAVGNFCPVSIGQNPAVFSTVEIMSYCPTTGESRLWRFNVPDDLTKIEVLKANPTKLFANPEAGEGEINLCNFGKEYLANNPTAGIVYTTDIKDDYSFNGLGTNLIGYTKVDSISCTGKNFGVFSGVDGSGEKWMSVIYGNRLGDTRDRYHSTVKYVGDIGFVTPTENGLIIGTLNGAVYTFYSILLDGPTVYYTGAKQTEAQEVTLDILSLTEKVGSKKFSFDLTEFTEKIDSNPKEGSTAQTKEGTYKLTDLADIKGPIFKIEAQVGPDVKSTVTVQPQFEKNGEYKPTQTTVPEPQSIVTEGTSSVGIYTAGATLQFYYYKTFDSFEIAVDVGKKSTIADASINNDESLLAAYVTQDGTLRAYVYTIATKVADDFVIAADFEATSVVVERINSQKFAVLAVNGKLHTGKAFILTVGSQDVITAHTFANIDSASMFSTTNTDIVVLTSDVEDSTLTSVSIAPDGTTTALTTGALTKKIAINSIKCRAYKSAPETPSCVITHNGNFVTDITLKYSSEDKTLNFENERQYFFFENYLPTYIDFNEEYVIMKSKDGDKEAMLFHRRGADLPKDLYWGLEPSQYYNKEGATTTNSLPLIYTSVEGETTQTEIRFTQDVTQASNQDPQNPFNSFKHQDVTITLGGNLTEDDAKEVTILFNGGKTEGDKVNILKIFKEATPKPEPPKPDDDSDIPWWVWVIIGMVVFLVLVSLLLRFLTKTKDEGEEEDVYYGSDGKGKPDEEG